MRGAGRAVDGRAGGRRDGRRPRGGGPGGPPDALERAAAEAEAVAILLGHTREDQAETVLLRLARGSGARSLSAMSAHNGVWRRPFLDVPRAVVHEAAAEMLAPLGLSAWSDPHNTDRAYARVRVRALLEALAADLGPGVVLGLVRSAELLRDDADALDAIADETFARIVTELAASQSAQVHGLGAACDDLAALPAAIRTRVIRLAALGAGCPPDALGVDHVRRVEALATDWHGQGAVALPGGVVAERACGRLALHPA